MEDDPAAKSPNPVDERMQGWTKDDIFDLLQGIKMYGSRDIAQIAEYLPTKTPNEIMKAIEHYKEKAAHQAKSPLKRKMWTSRVQASQPAVPLTGWAKFLQKSLSFKELHTETATAMRLIAEFENIPSAVETNNIDFRNVYHSLANAMEGKAIPEDTAMAALFHKCIVDTALTSKAFMRTGALQTVVEGIDMSDKAINLLPRPTDQMDLSILRHLASQRSYNPLNISEQNLKPN